LYEKILQHDMGPVGFFTSSATVYLWRRILLNAVVNYFQ